MDSAIAALLGTALGAAGTFAGNWLQQRHQTRREMIKSAAELGLEDYRHFAELVKQSGGSLLPMSVYVAYHVDVLNALANDKFGPDEIKKIEDRMAALVKALPRRN